MLQALQQSRFLKLLERTLHGPREQRQVRRPLSSAARRAVKAAGSLHAGSAGFVALRRAGTRPRPAGRPSPATPPPSTSNTRPLSADRNSCNGRSSCTYVHVTSLRFCFRSFAVPSGSGTLNATRAQMSRLGRMPDPVAKRRCPATGDHPHAHRRQQADPDPQQDVGCCRCPSTPATRPGGRAKEAT